MSTITLDPELADSLRELAEASGETAETVLTRLAKQYLRQARRQKIEQEWQAYQALYPTLKEKYLGQHIAIYQSHLVDADENLEALMKRIQEQYGRLPVLITQVQDKPIQEINIHRPRLIQ